MKQNAEQRPDPSLHRKAAIAHGRAFDHAGYVRIEPIPNFDLDRTIFNTLEGAASRFVMRTRVGKEPHWDTDAAQRVQAEYDAARQAHALPPVDPALMRFMVEECDFDVEHADGSFLDHLYFCFEYGTQHFAEHSPIVLLLHSILGTGTNTFAMEASKIPALRKLMTEFEWTHVEAFPSALRLLYDLPLRRELRANVARLDTLQSVKFNRVIDNAPITMSAEDFWVQLNFQLIHLIDFLPVANWSLHQNDTAFIIFRDLYGLLGTAGKRSATIDYAPADLGRAPKGEAQSLGAWLTTKIPVGLSEKMASKSVRRFSERIGHSMDYKLVWG
ncbi:MAG: hypothetical protein K0V04_32450 [Deltaproteobacteria bacterium]|nr:hypothetical protein [Deltaproteobacteria bacterium]